MQLRVSIRSFLHWDLIISKIVFILFFVRHFANTLAAVLSHDHLVLPFNNARQVNPIPTGHGRNQPTYQCHVNTAGRNRVKPLEFVVSNLTTALYCHCLL